MSLSKKPEDKKPVSSTDNKTPIVNTDNKKPVPKAVLGMMFPKIKSPKVSVDYPDIRSISTSGSSVSIPKEIKPSYISSTATPSLTEKAKNDAAVETTFDNTIQFVGRNMGLGNIKRTDPAWSMIQSDILKQKSAGLLTATKDEYGNPVYGVKTSWIDDLKAGYDEHDFLSKKGSNYFNADRKSAIDKLNESLVQERTTLLPKVENEYLKMAGGFVKPLEQTFVGGMAGVAAAASTSGPGVVVTGIPAFVIGAGTTFALTAPDATAIRYGTSLEQNYRIAKSKGMNDDDAYEAANSVAKVDAGGEIAMQALFAGMSGGAPKPTTSLFKESSKKALYETIKHEIKPIVGISSIAALGSGMSQVEAQKQGLQEDLSLKKALMSGSDLVTLHLIIRGLTGAVQVPKYVKASMANAMSNADKAAVKTIVKTGEANGVYPKGTMSKVNAVVEEFNAAKNSSPKYEGDDVRQQVVSGLTQKLEAKLAEQKNLADIHKADLQPEIDDLTARIQQAKTAENPLSVEVREDGTKVIQTPKIEQNATTEAKGQIQESSTTGGVSEYQGAEGVKTQETVQTDTGNRPISGTEEAVATTEVPVQESVQPKLSDRIRSLKIDESVLTGGEKGAMQSNIAGVPIAAWNTSVELIAKAVEAGEDIAVVIDRVIKDLKSKGLEVNESEFKKQFEIKDRATPTEKAEAKMEGIPTAEYESLKRIAAKQFEQNSETDPAIIAKNLRTELDAKMDTSKISDDVFMQIAKDGVSEIKEYPFKPGAAKRMTREEAIAIFDKKMGKPETPKASPYTTEQIVTNPKEVFKAMYTAATNVGKSIKDRFNIASDIIKDVMKNKGIVVDPKKVNKVVKSFITDKMDTETASEYFEEAMAEIENDAINGRTINEVKKKIKEIKSAAKQPYSTVAIQEGVAKIEFISPKKVSNPEEYLMHAENYRKSLTGEVPDVKNARKVFEDYIASEKKIYENKQTEKFQKKYDKMIEKGEDPGITKDEYVQLMMNPETIDLATANENILKFAESKAEVMREMTDVRQQMVSEAIDNSEIDPELVDQAREIASVDVKKIDPRNIKLFNNIIEDVLNGEEPSKMGQIRTDIGAFDVLAEMRGENMRIQAFANLKFSGFMAKLYKMFNKRWEGNKDYFKKYGLTNQLFASVFNPTDAATLRRWLITPFEINVNSKVNEKSKILFEKLGSLYEGGFLGTIKSIYDLSEAFPGTFDEGRIDMVSDMKIGFYALVSQFDDMADNLAKVKNSLINLSEISANNNGARLEYIENYLFALKKLGLIEDIKYRTDYTTLPQDITLKNLTKEEIYNGLTKKERIVLDLAIKGNKEISKDLRQSVRDNYGDDLDISKEDYISTNPFFPNDVDRITVGEEGKFSLPTWISNKKSSTAMARSKTMVDKTVRNGVETDVHYDISFLSNFQQKYRESLATAYSAEDVIQLNKIINSKTFKEIISGGDRKLQDNYNIFTKKVADYVEKKVSTWNLDPAQKAERNRVSKFLYGKLLNGWGQILKQPLPSLSILTTAGNAPSFIKSQQLFALALRSKPHMEALKTFLRTTSMSDRLVGGLEIYNKAVADLGTGDYSKLVKNTGDFISGVTVKPFEWGDQYSSINLLMTGYLKSLKKQGIIKSYSDFDIIKHINEDGINKQAHAYSENFLARGNNESSNPGKADVLREANSGVTRMLQSFNLNEWANFQIDTHIMGDKLSTQSEKLQAAGRIGQYVFGKFLFASTAWTIAEMNKKIAAKILTRNDTELAVVDEERRDEQFWTDGSRQYLGAFADMLLSGTGIIGSQSAKTAIGLGVEFAKKSEREKRVKMGEPTEDSWLDPSWNIVYRNNSVGVSGAWADDIMNIGKSLISKNQSDKRVESQRDAQKMINLIGLESLIMPTPDVYSITNAANKVIKNRAIDAEQQLVALWQEANDFDEDISDETRKADLDYFNYLIGKNKFSKAYVDYIKEKAVPLSARMDLYKTARKFDVGGKRISPILYNISEKSGPEIFKIINNRYPVKNLSDNEELYFMVQMGGITPDEYAMAYAMDKEGNVDESKDISEVFPEVYRRYEEGWAANPKYPTMKTVNKPGYKPVRLSQDEYLRIFKEYLISRDKQRLIK